MLEFLLVGKGVQFGIVFKFSAVVAGHPARELRLWRLRNGTPVLGVALGGHTGWVRTLAVGNKVMIR